MDHWCKISSIIFIFCFVFSYCQSENNLLKAFERTTEKDNFKSPKKDKETKQDIDLLEGSSKKPSLTSEKEIEEPRENKTIRRVSVSDIINPLRPQDWHGISSKFGTRVHPVLKIVKHHSGIDIPAPTGVPVYAVLDGVVIASGYDSASGNFVKIDHGNGFMSSYAHLSKIEAWKNKEVDRGEIIGRVGATGRVTGPHLHYTVFLNGKRVNPEKYLLWK